MAPVGIFETDSNGDCVFVNRYWLEFSGMTFEQALGPNWTNALLPEDVERVSGEWYAAAFAGRDFKLECRFLERNTGKEKWLVGSVVPLKNEHGEVTGYLGTILDITERKKNQEDLEWELGINAAIISLKETILSSDFDIERVSELILQQVS